MDGEEAETSYAYDNDGSLISMTNAERYSIIFVYDEMHRVTSMADARGGVTAFEYNDRYWQEYERISCS